MFNEEDMEALIDELNDAKVVYPNGVVEYHIGGEILTEAEADMLGADLYRSGSSADKNDTNLDFDDAGEDLEEGVE